MISSKHPKRTRELWAYQTTIVRETRRCGGNGWKAYDAMFRQWVASSPGTDWAKLNSAIYAVTFLAQSTKGRMCHHCLEADHGAEECALAPQRTAPPARTCGSTEPIHWLTPSEGTPSPTAGVFFMERGEMLLSLLPLSTCLPPVPGRASQLAMSGPTPPWEWATRNHRTTGYVTITNSQG